MNSDHEYFQVVRDRLDEGNVNLSPEAHPDNPLRIARVNELVAYYRHYRRLWDFPAGEADRIIENE